MTNEIEAVLDRMHGFAFHQKAVVLGSEIMHWANTLERLQQQPEPISEAGCEEKVNRSVSWTAQGAGFAQLRARVKQEKKRAEDDRHMARSIQMPYGIGFSEGEVSFADWVLLWLDAYEADAKSAS